MEVSSTGKSDTKGNQLPGIKVSKGRVRRKAFGHPVSAKWQNSSGQAPVTNESLTKGDVFNANIKPYSQCN